MLTTPNHIEELISGIKTLLPYPKKVEKLAQVFAKQLVAKTSETIPDVSIEKSETDFETVDLHSLSHEHCRSVGLEHIALETIRKLHLDQKLLELGLSKREVETAIGVVVGRLVKPGSERKTHYWLQNLTGLDELIGCHFSPLSMRKVYEVSDVLLSKKDHLENHLAQKEKDLFAFENAIVFYDLTNTYFEGSALGVPKAKRGHSKEKRSDAPLITLGLVLNQEGFPQRSHIFAGNVSEPSTLEEVIKNLQVSQKEKPIIVLDAGFSTEDNLRWLRKHHFPYLVCSRKREKVHLNDEYETIYNKNNDPIKVALLEKDASGEAELVCHSLAREQKECSIRKLHQERFEKALQQLKEGLQKKGRRKNYLKIIERISRLKQKYSRVSQHYDIRVEKDDHHAKQITWTCDTESLNQRHKGTYCLRVHGIDWKEEKLWKTYVMLTKVEEGFRCLKSELGLRPIYHQKETRIEGHLFISTLAYHVMQTILYQLDQANIHIRWETLRMIMSSQTRVTTSFKNDKGKTIHVRSTTSSEPIHREIYAALNISNKPGRRTKSII